MYQLVETIKIKDRVPQNLYWHQKRFELSFKKLYKKETPLKIADCLIIPLQFQMGLVKGRFLYNINSFTCEFAKYFPLKINSLKIVKDDRIDYSLKYTDREYINQLLLLKEDCNDILIVKNGRITDTSISNIVFYDGKKWITPAEPLLEGTSRARLLAEGKISTDEIMLNDLNLFSKFKLINAMNDFELQAGVNVSGIK